MASQIKLWTDRNSNIQDGCLLWGNRIIILSQGDNQALDILHETHPGVSRMKSLSRSYVWWLQWDKDIEERVKKYEECQMCCPLPPIAPLHPWEFLVNRGP